MDIVKSLRIKCLEAGTTLPKVCERAGVNEQTVRYWKTKKPRSFEILEKLEKAIEEIKAEKNGTAK